MTLPRPRMTGPSMLALWGTLNLMAVIEQYVLGGSGIDLGLYDSAVVIIYLFAGFLWLAERSNPPSPPLRRQASSGAAALLFAVGFIVLGLGTFFGDWLSLCAPIILAVGAIYVWMRRRTSHAEELHPLRLGTASPSTASGAAGATPVSSTAPGAVPGVAEPLPAAPATVHARTPSAKHDEDRRQDGA